MFRKKLEKTITSTSGNYNTRAKNAGFSSLFTLSLARSAETYFAECEPQLCKRRQNINEAYIIHALRDAANELEKFYKEHPTESEEKESK